MTRIAEFVAANLDLPHQTIVIDGVPLGGHTQGGYNWKTELWRSLLPRRLEGKVVDLGCSSGVLGVEAGLRGASEVVFVDYLDDLFGDTRKLINLYSLTCKTTFVSTRLEKFTPIPCDTLLAFLIFHWISEENILSWLAAARRSVVFAARTIRPNNSIAYPGLFLTFEQYVDFFTRNGYNIVRLLEIHKEENLIAGVAERKIEA